MRERPNRSDKYQYVLLESSYDDKILETFSNADSISNILEPYKYDEEIDRLNDELKKEFWKLVDKHCTPRQKDVLYGLAAGKTQMEIAKELGVNQSSITKSLNGNCDYQGNKKVYGGVVKKIKKHAKESVKIQEILARLNEIVEEKL